MKKLKQNELFYMSIKNNFYKEMQKNPLLFFSVPISFCVFISILVHFTMWNCLLCVRFAVSSYHVHERNVGDLSSPLWLADHRLKIHTHLVCHRPLTESHIFNRFIGRFELPLQFEEEKSIMHTLVILSLSLISVTSAIFLSGKFLASLPYTFCYNRKKLSVSKRNQKVLRWSNDIPQIAVNHIELMIDTLKYIEMNVCTFTKYSFFIEFASEYFAMNYNME